MPQSKLIPVTQQAEGIVPDPIKGQSQGLVPVSTSDLNATPSDLAAQVATDEIGAFENFSNAFQKSLIAGTKADLSELLGDHQGATEIAAQAEIDYPTDGGASEFLGNTIGSIAPVVPALIAPALSIPALTFYGLRSMGAGRGAVKSYEEISGEDVSSTDEALVSAGYGLVVFASERMGLGALKNVASKMAPKAFSNIMAQYARGSSKKTAQTILTEVAKVQGKGALIEGSQEGVEQSLTNLIDTYYGAKGIDDLLQGVPDAAFQGAVGGAILGAGATAIRAKDIKSELQKVSVDRDIIKSNPNIAEDEVTTISSFISAQAEVQGIRPKQAFKNLSGFQPAFGEETVIGVRRGKIDPEGAHFATEGSSTFFDPEAKGVSTFDLSKAKIADTGDELTKVKILNEALNDKRLTLDDKIEINKLIQNPESIITFEENENFPLPEAAKRLGFDGIKIFENDDITDPSTIFLFNTKKAKRISKKKFKEITGEQEKLPGIGEMRKEIHALQTKIKKGSVDSFISKSIPLYKRAADLESFTALEEWLGVKDGKDWTNKQAKKFRNEVDKFVTEGEVSDGVPIEAFQQYQTWLGNVSAHTFETGFFADAKTQTITFVDNIHGSSNVELNSPFDREQTAKRKEFKSLWNTFLDTFDTRSQFQRGGAPITGDAVVNMASTQDMIQSKVEHTAQNMSRTLQRNGYKGDSLIKIRQQLPLILENDKVFNSLPEAQRKSLQPFKDMWTKFTDDALQAYKEEGALSQGFFDDMRVRLAERKANSGKKGDQALFDKIDKQLESISEANFVPIPYRLWFESMIYNNPRKLNKVLKVLGTTERKTLFIRDLVDKKVIKAEDIDIFQIMGYYGGRLAKDIPLLKVKNAGLNEGWIKELKKGDKVDARNGFVRAPRNAPILKGMQIKNVLSDFISSTTQYRNGLTFVDKGLAVTKMGQFINPFFLPVYDIVQATMLGSFNPLSPKTFRNLKAAANDMRTMNEDWQTAGMNGARSTPYANPIENFNSSIEHIAEHPSTVVRSLKGLFSKDILKEAYNISWRTAWALDGFVRQMSYRHLTDDLGYSPEEAGRIAALYHGDYAGVPPNTRKKLNRVFFTPTFKIAMSKLFTTMIRDSINVSVKGGKIAVQKIAGQRPTVKISQEEKLHMASLARTIGLIGAMDVFFTSIMGFERDQWSRRYIKKDVETSQGIKDVVFTMSNPANMFLKYAFRVQESFGDPAITEPILTFLEKNSWELHPVWRMASGLIQNEKSNGEIIAPSLGNTKTKLERQMAYILRESSALVDEIATSVSGSTDEAATREIVQEELGKFGELASRMFVFAYTRESGQTKQLRQVEAIQRILNEEQNAIIDREGNFSPVMLEEINKNAVDRILKIIDKK